MTHPAPETPPAGKLVWASEDVLSQLGEQVQPQLGRGQRVARAAILAFFFTVLPAFAVFAVSTVAAPSVTDGAGVGTVALWAVQFAVLVSLTAIVTALRSDGTERAADIAQPSGLRVTLRLVWHALVTAGCAWLVLAVQGLAVGQVAVLVLLLVAVLHLLPLIAARLLARRQAR
ncbi:hypothetical protein [Micromonospora endophytica]|uniref:Uncharacterized protein n=1 Tax=Micromonospora endophytica TaxID=515350 RepID=A0A2W2CYX5_9ACTN|nr:hypothetical protein [Micromonospora endophytica]PZF96698.1 hypothetical protein C1I93_13545 [Micromonospora endophytica]RIW42549.1 hypothetical protein D3H59_22845 [Micromonospora endophytica]BCJ57474.1 hypothetical protein Jiend_08960 [Micromonospora endophytica]